METSLHRELKTLYATAGARLEAAVGGYRIDVVLGERLVEIQHGSLGAIRDKVRDLLDTHEVLVVKPIVVHKLLVKLGERGGPVVARRKSPKQGRLLDIFQDMVHFTRAFPHPRLTLEVPLIDIEERRFPGHGRRRRWRRGDHQVEDQTLLAIHEVHRFCTAADLAAVVGRGLPRPFHTGHVADSLDVARWRAQQIVYCLRQTGAVEQLGKRGNAWLYEFPPKVRRALAG